MKVVKYATVLAVLVAVVGVLPGSARAFVTLDACNPIWNSRDLPVRYYVGETVPSSLGDVERVRDIFQTSFGVWAEPCCSGFSAVDNGLTTARGDDYYDNRNTLSFEEDDWPAHLGDERWVLAVTVPVFDRGTPCYMYTADILFNAVGTTYIHGAPQFYGQSDLESIATHEIGHFIGLDHTPITAATMYEAYDNGIGARSLHQDDIDGVCFLYEQACSCVSDADCSGGQQCIGGACQVPPCQSDADCAGSLVCRNGDCVVAPCTSDADCSGGDVCVDGTCGPACPVCAECSSNSDCGAQGICIPPGVLSETAPSACTSVCNSPSECPGDSDCWSVQTDDGIINLCFNPDAGTAGICPPTYVCGGATDDPGGDDPGGDDPGGDDPPVTTGSCTICNGCETDADCGGGECITFADGASVCSEACPDGSCPGNSSCFSLEDSGGALEFWCLNDNAASAGICGGGWVCVADSDDACGGPCPGGESCNTATGRCEPDGPFGDIDPGERDVAAADETGGDDPSTDCVGCRAEGRHRVAPGLGLGLLLILWALWVRRPTAVRRRLGRER